MEKIQTSGSEKRRRGGFFLKPWVNAEDRMGDGSPTGRDYGWYRKLIGEGGSPTTRDHFWSWGGVKKAGATSIIRDDARPTLAKKRANWELKT